METGIATHEQAERALHRMDKPEFIGEYGMYLDALRHNAAMTISTGVMAVAQSRYGYTDRALGLIKRIFTSFSRSTPGALSEMSPDYGCFIQAWTIYSVMVPIVRYFFGVQPDAMGDRIIIAPNMPGEWNDASLVNIRLFDGSISIAFARVDGVETFNISGTCGSPIYFTMKHDCAYRVNGIEHKRAHGREALIAIKAG
jgi:hypothetical protein